MAEDQQQQGNDKPKRQYKPRTPNLDRVLEAIIDGEYDDDIFKLRDAFQQRVERKQEEVMALVREAFGEDAQIMLNKTTVEEATATPPMPRRKPEKNPFLDRLAKSNPQVTEPANKALDELAARHPQLTQAADEILPGPYKISPGDGNAYRVDDSVEAPEGMVMITDTYGGHLLGITKEEWDSWPDESGRDVNQGTTVTEQGEFERRGAIIGGLHPSDMGE